MGIAAPGEPKGAKRGGDRGGKGGGGRGMERGTKKAPWEYRSCVYVDMGTGTTRICSN